MTQPLVAKLDALTSLRFVAAAMIVVYHVRYFFGVPGDWGRPFPMQAGVTFFFVLSGFILTYVYPSLPVRSAPRFWWARFARIWPAHACMFLLTLALGALIPGFLHVRDRLNTAVANLALVHSWTAIPNYYWSFNTLSWSVSVELAFYLLFPLLVADLARTWAWKLGLSLLIVLGLVVTSPMLAEIPLLKENGVLVQGLVYASPLARLPEFVLGMCTCLLWQRIRTSDWFTPTRCTVAELAALAFCIGLMYACGVIVETWRAQLSEAVRIWFINGAPALGFCAVILTVAVGRGRLSWALTHPVLVLLGEISYSIYLVHHLLYRAIGPSEWALAQPFWLVYPGFLALVLALSYVSWRMVEVPSRRFLLSLVGGSATQPAPTVRAWWRPASPSVEMRTPIQGAGV